jgi:hypothetical protein
LALDADKWNLFLRRLGPLFSSKKPSYGEVIEIIGIGGLGVLAPLLCFFIAAIIHFQPNHSRLLKYFVLLVPLPLEDLFYIPAELFVQPRLDTSLNFYIKYFIYFPALLNFVWARRRQG